MSVVNQQLSFIWDFGIWELQTFLRPFSPRAFSSGVKDRTPHVLPDQRSWFTSGLRRSRVSTSPHSLSPEILSPEVSDLSTRVSHESTTTNHFGYSGFGVSNTPTPFFSEVLRTRSYGSSATLFPDQRSWFTSGTSTFRSFYLSTLTFSRNAFTRS
jgi:hypothetical protein